MGPALAWTWCECALAGKHHHPQQTRKGRHATQNPHATYVHVCVHATYVHVHAIHMHATYVEATAAARIQPIQTPPMLCCEHTIIPVQHTWARCIMLQLTCFSG